MARNGTMEERNDNNSVFEIEVIEKITINAETVVEAFIDNFLLAIWGAFFVYWSIYLTILFALFFNLPSIGAMILGWAIGEALNIISSFVDIGSVDSILLSMETKVEFLKNFGMVMVDKYGYYACYLISLTGLMMNDLGLSHFKEKIVNKFENFF